MITRCLLLCTALLLFVSGVYGGVYQRTRDGKAIVWNNHPEQGDEATWSGDRDSKKYATGAGVLTWYKAERKLITGSNLPSVGGRTTLVSRCSGEMVRGKFDGQVVIVDGSGKTFHGMFANGSKTGDWAAGPPPAAGQPSKKTVHAEAEVDAPAEGPPPAVAVPQPKKSVSASPVVETSSNDSSLSVVAAPPSSLRTVAAAETSPQPSIVLASSAPSSKRGAADPAAKTLPPGNFQEETEAVLARVSDATDNFHPVDRLDSVKQLPAPVSESAGPLVDQARDLRSKSGYEAAPQELRSEIGTAEALSVVDQVTRNIAANDVSEAGSRLAVFLKTHPEPTANGQKALWGYLTSMRTLCSRLEKDAYLHVQRAQSFAAAGKNSDAIREYQEAYRTFPNPATAQTIHQLIGNSHGL